MNSLLLIGGSLALLLLMQVITEAPVNQENAANAVLVSPVPGAPLSAEQLDRRTRNLPNGSSAVEEVRSNVYRDSKGRLRIEELTPDAASDTSRVVLIDPEAGAKVILLAESKTALRWTVPKLGEEGFASMGGVGEALPHGKWKVTIEGLGRRVIEGIELEGTRVTHTPEDHPSAKRVEERWFSKSLQLMTLVVASGPTGTHTAALQEFVFDEPDEGLFSIPSEYQIQEIRWSEP